MARGVTTDLAALQPGPAASRYAASGGGGTPPSRRHPDHRRQSALRRAGLSGGLARGGGGERCGGTAAWPTAQGRDGRWYACVWAARETRMDGHAWQPWMPGPPAPDTPPALGGASFAAAHALGYWLAESADDGAGVPGKVAAKGSAGQSG